MDRIYTFGFEKIVFEDVRDATLNKAIKLFNAGHVREVTEIHIGPNIKITAKVVPQTNVNNAAYKIEICLEVSS
jgi:hypothetical protein